MRVTDRHSAKGGEAFINANHPSELAEVLAAISSTNATDCLRKVSREKTMPDQLLYAPTVLNEKIKGSLHPNGWGTRKTTGIREYSEPRLYFPGSRFREMDGIKNKVGLEVQFGKYAFME